MVMITSSSVTSSSAVPLWKQRTHRQLDWPLSNLSTYNNNNNHHRLSLLDQSSLQTLNESLEQPMLHYLV
uniref:Uncharacterized protein n=1 Tax=Ditylenchus dipsaci TaxID=166011 RepID=A0A915E4L9_9BILA